jgi:hypothetical protein
VLGLLLVDKGVNIVQGDFAPGFGAMGRELADVAD